MTNASQRPGAVRVSPVIFEELKRQTRWGRNRKLRALIRSAVFTTTKDSHR